MNVLLCVCVFKIEFVLINIACLIALTINFDDLTP